MIRNFIAETSVAPGTSSVINLAGAVSGRRTFRSEFPTGADVFYAMRDSGQAEFGYGVLTHSAPDTLSRAVVLWDSVNGRVSPSRRNFTGTTIVYCDIPSERAVFADKNNLTTLLGGLVVPGAAQVTGALTAGAGGSFANVLVDTAGYQKLPGGLIHQWGTATTGGGGTVVQNFPIVFPTACMFARAWVQVTPASGSYTAHAATWNQAGASLYGLLNGTLTSGLNLRFEAFGN
jgi:hypothetical protein